MPYRFASLTTLQFTVHRLGRDGLALALVQLWQDFRWSVLCGRQLYDHRMRG